MMAILQTGNGHLSQCTTVTKKLNLIFLKIQTHVALLPLFEKNKKIQLDHFYPLCAKRMFCTNQRFAGAKTEFCAKQFETKK